MSEKSLHLAIIPDGNRRWARGKGLLPWNGHERAVENFRDLVEWCRENPRIGTLTVWCFSTENWKRDKQEVDALMKLYEEYLRKEQKRFAEKNTRFLHSGRLDRVPASLATLIREVEAQTAAHKGFTLNLAVDYGGKDEIVRAARKIKAGEEVTEESFRSLLDHPELPDMDIIFRSSGELRFSNFFLWEGAYAEWIISKKLFPDVTTKDLEAAVKEYDDRKRRFGS